MASIVLKQSLRGRPGTLAVTLSNGNAILVPLSLYPTLATAKPAERADFRLIGRGRGIHWPALDLDLSIRGLLLAIPVHQPARRTRSR